MSNSHRVPYDLNNADLTIEDPGNGGTIVVDRLPAVVLLRLVDAIETRTVADPMRAGQLLTITNPANTCYLAYNASAETMILDRADETVVMQSIASGSSYKWKVIVGPGGDAASTVEGFGSLTALTAAEIDTDSDVSFGVSDAGAARSLSLAELKKTGVQVANVDQYGADPTGATESTAAIQAAIDSGLTVVGSPGATYVVSSITMDNDRQTVDFTGCTIKRKNATSGFLLNMTADHTKVVGGVFDGNLANQSPANDTARYGYGAVGVSGDHCEVANCEIFDEAGIGIKGYECQYAKIHHNNVRNCDLFGIYVEMITADAYGNSICDNYVDVSDVSDSLGIYLTGKNDLTLKQRRWTVSRNIVLGDTSSASSESVGITARGSDGTVESNHVDGFCLGISCDSTDRTTIVGNRVENVNSETKYCYELNGSHNTFCGNYGRPAADGYGLFMSNPVSGSFEMDSNSICGNVFEHASSGNFVAITIQAGVGRTAKYNSISGNAIKTNYRGIVAVRKCDGLTITGNAIDGPGSGTSQSRALYLNEMGGRVTFVGNTVHGFERIIGCYSALSATFTVDTGTDVITASSHGLADGDTVMLSTTTTIPGGLSTTATYFVVNSTSTTFQVATSPGGTPANITTTGTGTHTVKRAYSGINVASNDFSQDNPTAGNWVVIEGSAVFGHRVHVLWNTANSYNQLHYLDRAANLQIQYSDSYATPESAVSAGIGSLYLSSIGGSGTTLFVKQSGTGNTGWSGK